MAGFWSQFLKNVTTSLSGQQKTFREKVFVIVKNFLFAKNYHILRTAFVHSQKIVVKISL
jgi:hypothetical protein